MLDINKIIESIKELIKDYDYKDFEYDDNVKKIIGNPQLLMLLKSLFKNIQSIDEEYLQSLSSDETIQIILETYLEMNDIVVIKNEYYEEDDKNFEENNEYFEEDDKDSKIIYDEDYYYEDATKQYLNEIGKYPPLNLEEERYLLEQISKGDVEAKNKFAKHNLRLVVSIAKRYLGRGMEFLELIQEGNLGLLKAIDKFNLNFGTKFSTYAVPWIHESIRRALQEKARLVRIPAHMEVKNSKINKFKEAFKATYGCNPTIQEISEKMNISKEVIKLLISATSDPVSLDKPLGSEEDTTLENFIGSDSIQIENDVLNNYLVEYLNNILKCLKNREREIIIMRFLNNMSLEETGKELNITRERVRQIEAKALVKLRHPRNTRKVKDYLYD